MRRYAYRCSRKRWRGAARRWARRTRTRWGALFNLGVLLDAQGEAAEALRVLKEVLAG